jgi:hypothetical protein
MQTSETSCFVENCFVLVIVLSEFGVGFAEAEAGNIWKRLFTESECNCHNLSTNLLKLTFISKDNSAEA